jgi:hypothetical protein
MGNIVCHAKCAFSINPIVAKKIVMLLLNKQHFLLSFKEVPTTLSLVSNSALVLASNSSLVTNMNGVNTGARITGGSFNTKFKAWLL